MAYSTSQINDFKLTYIKDNGFVLSFPTTYNPECTLDYVHHQMLFDKFLEYTRWGQVINISNASDLNEIVSKGKYDDLIRLAEVYYNNQLVEVADRIYNDKYNIKVVLIAGPSSSGKTTTSKKLQTHLKSRGLNTYQISIDDYFVENYLIPGRIKDNFVFTDCSNDFLKLARKYLNTTTSHFNFFFITKIIISCIKSFNHIRNSFNLIR